MRILFIYPDYKVNIDPLTGSMLGVDEGGWYMEGVASLSAVLKEAGHDVALYHLTSPVGRGDFQETLRREAPDIMGFVTMTREYPQVREYVGWAKDALDVPVISGSYHPTTLPEEVIATDGVDMLCRGEGEAALLELVSRMDAGEDYGGTESIWVKQDDNVRRNPVRPLMEDIDVLPLPDFSIFDFSKLLSTRINTGVVILSRGCPYSCTYCSNKRMRDIYPNKSRYSRFHSPEYSIDYLKKLLAAYPGVKYLNFRDDILPWKGGWLERFTSLYRKEIGLPFICNYRANLVTPEIVRMLRQAGCYQMFFGVESGNDYIRNEVLNRHMSREKIVEAFEACRDAGIKTVAYNMVGLPYEDKSRVLDTVKLNAEIRADHSLSPIYYPYPDTVLFETAVREGWVPEVYDYREDRFVDQPSLPRDQLYFARHYFRTFVRIYRALERLPEPVTTYLERMVDAVFVSPRLPHRALVAVAAQGERAWSESKDFFRRRFPAFFLWVRDRVRGVEQEQ
ncbi:MAG: radical SAM protein [Actinomycetota bacterium]|nr:radical SAM protein [Actinomycetota bacterium]MDD5667828.1 radical SAM protein [Actinomycetota bacterium]